LLGKTLPKYGDFSILEAWLDWVLGDYLTAITKRIENLLLRNLFVTTTELAPRSNVAQTSSVLRLER
jgi:hypothetical protein